MNTWMDSTDGNNWKSTLPTLYRQDIVEKIEAALQKYDGPGPIRSSIEIENNLFERASSRDDYTGLITRALVRLSQNTPKVTGQPPTQSSTTPSRLQNFTLQQSCQQVLANQFPQTLNQTISSLINNNIEMQRGVIQMREVVSSLQLSQMPSSSMANQINISMPNQMNVSIDSPSATVTITGPTQMATGSDNSISGVLVNDARMDLANILEKKIICKHGTCLKDLKGQLSLSTSSQLTSALQNGMPGSQTVAGPMRIKFGRVLYNPIADRTIAGQKNSPRVTHIQLRSQAPYQLLRQNANGRTGAMIIRSGPSTMLPHNGEISSVTFSNQLPPKEEQAYQDKVKELGRYMDPIKKMISILGNGEIEKIVKLKRLLEILSSPHSPRARTTMEALLKIEVVLKKLDVKVAERQTQINEQNRMIDDISSSLQKTTI